jgi:hypothetical protein
MLLARPDVLRIDTEVPPLLEVGVRLENECTQETVQPGLPGGVANPALCGVLRVPLHVEVWGTGEDEVRHQIAKVHILEGIGMKVQVPSQSFL